MNRTFALAATAALISAAPAAAAEITISSPGPVVELTVSAETQSRPDIVNLSAGVSTRAMTADEATRTNALKMTRLVGAIRALGVKDADIQTSGFSVAPQWTYNNNAPPTFAGYEVSNTVSFKLRKVEQAGPALDALIKAGANQVGGPSFALDDPTAARAQARRSAYADAAARARDYAAMAGFSGVKLLSVEESYSSGPVPYEKFAGRAAAPVSASTPIEPGQVDTSVTLIVKYEMVR